MSDFLNNYRVEFIATCASLGLTLMSFELVRRKEIKEKYSFLWFLTSVSVMGLAVKRTWLEAFASWLGIFYPPTALFLVLSFFVILILIHFSTVLTKLIHQNQKLAQKVALLESEVKEKKEQDKHDHYAA